MSAWDCLRKNRTGSGCQCLCERVDYKDVQVYSSMYITRAGNDGLKQKLLICRPKPHLLFIFTHVWSKFSAREKDWHFISCWLTEGIFQCRERLLFYGALPFIRGVRHLLKAAPLTLFFECPLCVNAPDLCPSMHPYGVSSNAQSTCMFTNGRRKKKSFLVILANRMPINLAFNVGSRQSPLRQSKCFETDHARQYYGLKSGWIIPAFMSLLSVFLSASLTLSTLLTIVYSEQVISAFQTDLLYVLLKTRG